MDRGLFLFGDGVSGPFVVGVLRYKIRLATVFLRMLQEGAAWVCWKCMNLRDKALSRLDVRCFLSQIDALHDSCSNIEHLSFAVTVF